VTDGDRQLTLTRVIAATPDRIWQAFTDPALLPLWFGPDGFRCQTKEIDLRVGGQWRFDMVAPDGTVFVNRHRFTLHQPGQRLEFLMDADDDAAQPMQVVITLTPEGQGTRLTQTITLPDAAAKARALGFGADRLGMQTLGKLAALVEAL
jgi:uncharacterized protein YndB with AHSA1/START domain